MNEFNRFAGSDGTIRAVGENGTVLVSKLGEPIELIHEELLESDKEYREEMTAFLGDGKTEWPRGRPKAKPGAQLKGKSLAAEFASVTAGKIVKSELGYRLGANGNTVALALNKLEEPLTGSATWTLKMKANDGAYKNGFLVFGDGPVDNQLIKCGIQFVQGTLRIIEGPTGNEGPKAKLEGNLGRVFELTVSVDLAAQKVTLTSGKQSLTHQLKRPLTSITHLGFASWNAVTDFSALE